jgi:hypothetical protein
MRLMPCIAAIFSASPWFIVGILTPLRNLALQKGFLCMGSAEMIDFCWVPTDNGALVSEAGWCRLTVATIGGLPRFLVHREAADPAGRIALLVASGTRPSLPGAMTAAEATANRIAAAETPNSGARR